MPPAPRTPSRRYLPFKTLPMRASARAAASFPLLITLSLYTSTPRGGDAVRRQVKSKRIDADLRRNTDTRREERAIHDEEAADLMMLAAGRNDADSRVVPHA